MKMGQRGAWEFRKGLLFLFGSRREVSGGDSISIDASMKKRAE